LKRSTENDNIVPDWGNRFPDNSHTDMNNMAGLSGIILFIISFYATINFFRLYSIGRRIFHFCLGTSAAFLALIGIASFLAIFFPVLDPEFIGEWSTVFSVSFLLSAAAALLREFRPVFSRFPKSFTFAPLVLILVYPLIIETVVVKQWTLALYQGSSLLIGLLIFSFKSKASNGYAYMLVGVLFFTVTYVAYWIPDSYFSLPAYAWMLLTSCGILIITIGYNHVYDLEEQLVDREQHRETWFV
jgi:hypothetical protein